MSLAAHVAISRQPIVSTAPMGPTAGLTRRRLSKSTSQSAFSLHCVRSSACSVSEWGSCYLPSCTTTGGSHTATTNLQRLREMLSPCTLLPMSYVFHAIRIFDFAQILRPASSLSFPWSTNSCQIVHRALTFLPSSPRILTGYVQSSSPLASVPNRRIEYEWLEKFSPHNALTCARSNQPGNVDQKARQDNRQAYRGPTPDNPEHCLEVCALL